MNNRFFEHRFSNVEDYLHHRPPYLMVERIVAIGGDHIETEKRISGAEFCLAGHFPGAPILPGAMLQEMSTQTAGILIAAKYNPMHEFDTHDPFFNEYALGVLVKVKSAKFMGFARPGDMLHARIDLKTQVGNLFEFSASVSVASRTIMRNSFQLANVLATTLRGSAEESLTS